MVKLSWALIGYLCLSLILFLTTSNTIIGGIVYLFMILPLYGVILMGWWLFVGENRSTTIRIKYWIWSIVLVLQMATILASPGNCYGVKQGARCYSNLQIWISNILRTGYSDFPHWELVEDAFPMLALAYGIAVFVGSTPTRE